MNKGMKPKDRSLGSYFRGRTSRNNNTLLVRRSEREGGLKLTDQEIVNQLKNGNTGVFKVLYNDFNKITSFITQNSGGEEEAKDFFHEALIILYEKVLNNDFKLEAKLSTYLFSVCKNLWLSYLRDYKPMIFSSVNDKENDFQWSEDTFETIEINKDYNEKLNFIIQKINELEEPCYSILMMFYFKKMSYFQIAQKLNYKTEKVVKNQKYRCIQKLREGLPSKFLEMH